MNLENKIILVTGASSGLGRGLVLAFAKRRVSLVIVARRMELLEEIKALVAGNGIACLAIQADLLDQAQAEDVVAQSVARFGHIDLVVHSVGGGRPLPVASATAEQILGSMQNNYATLVNLFVPLLRQLRKQDSASVVIQINSLASRIEIPRGGHYSAAKVAGKRFFDSARIELRNTPIKLLTFHPGFVQTANKKEKMMMGITLEKAINLMLHAIEKEKTTYSFPWPLVWLFNVIALLPQTLRAKVLARLSDRESGKYTD